MLIEERIPRVVVWFSCGAASAVAAKLALEKYGKDRVSLVYCDVMVDEHPDNARFFKDVEAWLGVTVTRISSQKYTNLAEVFDRTRYMSGPAGARCTVEMKKVPRFNFQEWDDIHIFGYTFDEKKRAVRFEAHNPELFTDWILIDQEVAKQGCLDYLEDAGIKLPVMYSLGYRNNNCLGCVKASSVKYWNKIRKDFPDVFEERARQSRELGAKLVVLKKKRIFLDELPPEEDDGVLEDLSCGPECAIPGSDENL